MPKVEGVVLKGMYGIYRQCEKTNEYKEGCKVSGTGGAVRNAKCECEAFSIPITVCSLFLFTVTSGPYLFSFHLLYWCRCCFIYS